jgi:DNA-binding transcriptional LysR family regulator
MLENLEALLALERYGTVSEAATRLRLTQSAVSKRLQALQSEVGFALTEPEGRRLRLTAKALRFLEQARPLLAELKGLFETDEAPAASSLSLALADSVASSWGPALVKSALVPGLEIRLHAHRSVLVQESVRLGRYHMGLCTDAGTQDLVSYPVAEEAFVRVNAGLAPKPSKDLPLVTIEAGSASWKAIEARFRAHPELSRARVVPVESFTAALQMAKAGFGQALIPAGLAHTMRVPTRSYRGMPDLRRRVTLVTRKNVTRLATFEPFRTRLEAAAEAIMASWRLIAK